MKRSAIVRLLPAATIVTMANTASTEEMAEDYAHKLDETGLTVVVTKTG
jgi:hypothetical protein